MLFVDEVAELFMADPLKDPMVRAGQSTERAVLIYQHSELVRQQEVAAALNARVEAIRGKGAKTTEGPSGADLVRGT